MGGDNDLAPMALADIDELEQVGSTDKVHFTVLADVYCEYDSPYGAFAIGLADNSGNLVTPMMQITKHPEEGVQSHLTDSNAVLYPNEGFNSADPANLTNFIKWSAQRFPADNYALVIWDHGSSWLPGRVSTAAVTDMYEGQGNSMFIHEIDWAIKNSGIHLDLLDFDACNMGSVEVVYQLKDEADYISCSQRTVPGFGNDYEAIASYLTANPSATGVDLGKIIIDSFIEFSTQNDQGSVTRSLIQTSKLNAVASAFSQVVPYLADPGIISPDDLRSTFNEPIRFYRDVDIINYSDVLPYHINNPQLLNSLVNLKNAISGSIAYNRVFTSSQESPDWTFGSRKVAEGQDINVAWASGLSIFLPTEADWNDSNFSYYTSIGFCKDTGWNWVIQHAYQGKPYLDMAPGNWWAGLAWSTNVDLDLYVFEPTDNSGEIFNIASPCIGTTGINGYLSPDSFWTGDSFEYYQTFPEVIWGPYFFIAAYYMDDLFANSAWCQLAIGADPNDENPLTTYEYFISANEPLDPDFGPGVVYFGFALYNPDDGYWYFFEGDRGGDSVQSPDSIQIPQLEPDCLSSEQHQIRRPSGNFDPELIESYHAQGRQLADDMAQYQKEK
jgi:hypothetical protein